MNDEHQTTGGNDPQGTGGTRATPPAAPAAAPAAPEQRRWGWLVPAVTFLLGLVLGGIIIFAQQSGRDAASSGGAGTPTPTTATSVPSGTTSSPVAVVRVPAECLSVADDSKALVDVASSAVTAARDLDAAALADAVRRLDEAQKKVTASADTCRQVEATLPTLSETSSPTT